MYKRRTVKYKPENGLVSVEIKNHGFVNQGAFSVHITDGTEINKIGDGRFGDGVPDIFLISINPELLQRWMLIILGSYASAYGHSQVSVDYNFYQKSVIIDTEQIRENTSPLVAHHDFNFKKS